MGKEDLCLEGREVFWRSFSSFYVVGEKCGERESSKVGKEVIAGRE